MTNLHQRTSVNALLVPVATVVDGDTPGGLCNRIVQSNVAAEKQFCACCAFTFLTCDIYSWETVGRVTEKFAISLSRIDPALRIFWSNSLFEQTNFFFAVSAESLFIQLNDSSMFKWEFDSINFIRALTVCSRVVKTEESLCEKRNCIFCSMYVKISIATYNLSWSFVFSINNTVVSHGCSIVDIIISYKFASRRALNDPCLI